MSTVTTVVLLAALTPNLWEGRWQSSDPEMADIPTVVSAEGIAQDDWGCDFTKSRKVGSTLIVDRAECGSEGNHAAEVGKMTLKILPDGKLQITFINGSKDTLSRIAPDATGSIAQ